jgi:hypothetical protein
MSWCQCPNCHEQTAFNAPSGKRCIPCGYGLNQRDQWRTPEESRRAAKILSGEDRKRWES